jgi:hypothetical protein
MRWASEDPPDAAISNAFGRTIETRVLYDVGGIDSQIECHPEQHGCGIREVHRKVDVLAGRCSVSGREERAQERFPIFNTLFQSKKQIVVTSDRPPKTQRAKRLKSRFSAGIVVDILSPDFETRPSGGDRGLPMLGYSGSLLCREED